MIHHEEFEFHVTRLVELNNSSFMGIANCSNRVARLRIIMQSPNGGRFDLLFTVDTALAAVSEEKLCRLVCECGRVCERRKF